jgi:hypothetical protein
VASVSHPDSDRLLMGSALRRSGVCRVICAVLLAVLVFDLLAATCRIHNMRDGIVYGGLVALGFNWFESALYVAHGCAE